MSKKVVKNILISVAIVAVVVTALLSAYLINYLKPLSNFDSMIEDNGITIVGNTEYVSRGAIEKMISYSGSDNVEHYNKYKKILLVPLNSFPMTAKQQVELGFFATDESDTLKFFNAQKNQTITVENDELDFSIEK